MFYLIFRRDDGLCALSFESAVDFFAFMRTADPADYDDCVLAADVRLIDRCQMRVDWSSVVSLLNEIGISVSDSVRGTD